MDERVKWYLKVFILQQKLIPKFLHFTLNYTENLIKTFSGMEFREKLLTGVFLWEKTCPT